VSDHSRLLEVDGLSVRFGGVRALKDLAFIARAGEVRAIIGPNGAGKTTVFNAITGYVQPNSGMIRFRGKEIQGLPPHIVSSLGVRRTFQNGGLFGDMTVLENILAGLHAVIGGSFAGLLFATHAARAVEREAVRRARQLLATMGIAALESRLAKDLPGGQQRLVEIARALATEPPLLLLDEPAVGLAPPTREQLMQVIRRLAGESGVGILLIEHSIDMVMSGADVIIVLNYGQRIAEGAPSEIRANREVLDAYLGHG
jgi:branched-chain amino acid transport system ATP-binding protein